MNSQDDFISIAEFAKIAGITPRAVYKRINKPVREQDEDLFANHVKMVDGKKRINKGALSLFNTNVYEPVHEPVPEQCEPGREPVREPVHEPNENQILTILQETLDTLKGELEAKTKQLNDQSEQSKNQLAIKDGQIEELNKANKISNDRLQEANDRLNNRFKEVNQLTHQNQILLDQQQSKPVEPAPVKKKSFWDRFRKED